MWEAVPGWLLFAACALAPPLAFLFPAGRALRIFFAALIFAVAFYFFPVWLLLVAGPLALVYVASLAGFAADADAAPRAPGVLVAAGLLTGWIALLWPGPESFAPFLPGDAPRDVESLAGALAEIAAHPISGPLALAALTLFVTTALAAWRERRAGRTAP